MRSAESKLRVLLLTWDYPPARGGIQSWMFELATRLPDAEVTVITAAGATGSDVGSRVVRLRTSRLGRLAWLVHAGLRALIGSLVRPPDLIVCGHVNAVPAALLPSWTLRIPFVVFAYAWEVRRRRSQGIVGFLLRQATLVFASSRFTQLELLARNVAANSIRVLYPGVSIDRFATNALTRGSNSEQRATKTIVTVSRLNERYKGHDMVIRALPLVRAKCRDIRYVIAGEGCLRAYLMELTNSLGVQDIVEFTGEISDDGVTRLIGESDLVVQVSRESADGGAEGFGIVCLEAAAAGKPVVAGRSGGLPDAVVHGVTGLLVDPTDLFQIADAMLEVLLDSESASRLGRQAQARVKERFTWDQMACAARSAFGEVVGRPWPVACASSS